MYTDNTLNKDVYTVREIANLLHCIPNAVTAAIKAGRLRAFKISKIYLITREDLAEYLEYRERRDNGRR